MGLYDSTEIEVLVSVMAYPAISTKHGEVVCVAGFRHDTLWQPDWVRLFPFRVRDVPAGFRVRKWDVVRLRVHKAESDHRPESMTPDMDSIVVTGHLDTSRNWHARKQFVDPHRGKTMLKVLDDHQRLGTSLAVVEPGEVLDVEATKRPEKELAEAKAKATREAAQGNLFALDDRQPLEPVPYDFHVVVRYPDESEPRRLKIIDWEINQAFRKYRREYTDPAVRVSERWRDVVLAPGNDPAYFVGNMHRFPEQWLLLGVFWPKRSA